MTSSLRRRIRRFERGAIKILVSTAIGSHGQDIPDISIVIRFGAVDSLEQLKQEMGRAGRDPQIFAQAHFLVEKSCFQAQKKSIRKKQKTTNAAAIDGGEASAPRDRPEANDAPVESIEFPVLLDDDKLPDNLQWRKKLNPGVHHYAAAQDPDCRRDVSDEYFGNPVRERVLANALCCDLCANDGPFPPKAPETHPTTPPPHSQSAASSTATTPNNNGKRGRRAAASDTDAGAKRRGGHLTECKEIVERWATEMYEKDWAGSGLTSDVFITDTMITYLAHNRFSSLAHLCNSLERSTRSWGLVEDYGNDILGRLAREAERVQRQLEQQEKRERLGVKLLHFVPSLATKQREGGKEAMTLCTTKILCMQRVGSLHGKVEPAENWEEEARGVQNLNDGYD
ncbi:hypothetical protein R3P38DRAFT_3380470 [Favolaschia claudopus]|uniref:DNA 3'-5' helicase n=1 Tax=Favolaschia claudopus TaxID=2862362 RepID=A0AAV9Z1X1_9AGAR